MSNSHTSVCKQLSNINRMQVKNEMKELREEGTNITIYTSLG